jgi:hypothetical protein
MPPRRQTSQAQQQRQAQQGQRQQSRQQVRTATLAAQSARSVQQSAGGGHFAQYQAIIIAEFIACELLIAVTPFATRKNKAGLSPYRPRDMTKLLAVGAVFFVLELAAVTGPGAGRAGAWAGLLVLLVTGMGEASNVVAKDLDIFTGGARQAQPSGETT